MCYRNDNENTLFCNCSDQAFSITTNPMELNLSATEHIMVWPGEGINVMLEALDELGHPTAAYVRLNIPTGHVGCSCDEHNLTSFSKG